MRWFDKDLRWVITNLELAASLLDDVRAALDMIKDVQQEKIDNVPESLQNTVLYELMESRLSTFEDALSELEEIDFEETINNLQDIE